MRDLTFKTYKNEERIGIEDSIQRLRKTLSTYKDYSSGFYKVWSEASINYTSIIVSLFGAMASQLQGALTEFYGLVLQLSKVHDWKETLLLLAIEVYLHIIT